MTHEAIQTPGCHRHRHRFGQAQGGNSVLAIPIQIEGDERQETMFGEAIETKFAKKPSVLDEDPTELFNGPEDNRSERRVAESVTKLVHKVNVRDVDIENTVSILLKELATKRQRDDGVKKRTEDTELDHYQESDEEEAKWKDVRLMEEVCRPSTLVSYKRNQSIFKKWCDRERFKDGYMKELLPPLRIDGSAVRASDLISRPVANRHKSAIRYLYISQCLADGVVPNVKDVLKDERIEELMEEYIARLGKSGHSSITRSTVGLTACMKTRQAVIHSTPIEMEREKEREQEVKREEEYRRFEGILEDWGGYTKTEHDTFATNTTYGVSTTKIAGLYIQIPAEQVRVKVRTYIMEPRDAPFFVLWLEWFGANGEKPSIWSLDKHAPYWRTHQEPKFKLTYYLKKKTVYEALKAIDAVEDELEEKMRRGRDLIEEAIGRHGSISRYYDTFRQRRGGVKTE
ncbi:hypothetical protein K457DRAFT_15852 [Linnemannia elongata AG-77]|uniref:Uncharacterized protein n=1 Tax=Linnemannia elongata AG-77 TaxID=1314771 RepID=A0A197K5M6_9FUNG|nr:hypothetical protein K457DRAFT_15852 [Linnemannia elongata AG-77]